MAKVEEIRTAGSQKYPPKYPADVAEVPAITLAHQLEALKSRAKSEGVVITGLSELTAPAVVAALPPRTPWEAQQAANKAYRDAMGKLASARQHAMRLAADEAAFRAKLETKVQERADHKKHLAKLEEESLEATRLMAFPTVPAQSGQEGEQSGGKKEKKFCEDDDTPEAEAAWREVQQTMKEIAKKRAAIQHSAGTSIDHTDEGRQLAQEELQAVGSTLGKCVNMYETALRGSQKRRHGEAPEGEPASSEAEDDKQQPSASAPPPPEQEGVTAPQAAPAAAPEPAAAAVPPPPPATGAAAPKEEPDEAMETGAEGEALSPTVSPAHKKYLAQQHYHNLKQDNNQFHANLEAVAQGRQQRE